MKSYNIKSALNSSPAANTLASCERGTNTTYAANELNQYTSIVGGPAESEPEFDDDGNQTLIRTATGMWRVTYNGENRPVRWENITSESNNLSFVALTEEDREIAQLGSNAHDFQMAKYFKKRYPRLLGYAQNRFANAINRRIDCESDIIDANSGDASPLAYAAGSIMWPWEDCEFGDDYGDDPQNWWERMASLGNFSIDISRPVKINYHGECVDGRREYDWSTDIKVIDDLGLDSGNGWLYRLFGGIALPRTVILAKWTLTGRGCCKCCDDR